MPRHYASSAPILELHKQWVVNAYLGVDMPKHSASAIGRHLGVGKTSVQNALRRWGVKRERVIPSYDYELLKDLSNTLSIRQLSEKWGVSYSYMRRTLKQLGVEFESHGIDRDAMQSMKLSEFYTNWIDVKERTIVTVNKKPMFVAIPIGDYENE